MIQKSHSWAYNQKRQKIYFKKIHLPQSPLQHYLLFTTAKTWMQTLCPSTDEWTKKCDIYTEWNITQP